MKQFLVFVRKEFRHVLRDRRTLLILFGLPVIQILIFGFALTNEVKNAKILIVDNAKDISSQQIISKITASQYFDIEVGFYYGSSYVSYGITVAISIATFLAWWALIGISYDDDRIFGWLIFNGALILGLQPK